MDVYSYGAMQLWIYVVMDLCRYGAMNLYIYGSI